MSIKETKIEIDFYKPPKSISNAMLKLAKKNMILVDTGVVWDKKIME